MGRSVFQLFSALTLVPTIQLFNQIGVAAVGAVFFEEFDFYDTHKLYVNSLLGCPLFGRLSCSPKHILHTRP